MGLKTVFKKRPRNCTFSLFILLAGRSAYQTEDKPDQSRAKGRNKKKKRQCSKSKNEAFTGTVAWLKECKLLLIVAFDNFYSASALITQAFLDNTIRLTSLKLKVQMGALVLNPTAHHSPSPTLTLSPPPQPLSTPRFSALPRNRNEQTSWEEARSAIFVLRESSTWHRSIPSTSPLADYLPRYSRDRPLLPQSLRSLITFLLKLEQAP